LVEIKKGERVIKKISEVTGIEDDRILLQDLGQYEDETNEVKFTGLVPHNMRRLMDVGMANDFFDLEADEIKENTRNEPEGL
jgi:hypothetical protein